MSTVLRSASIFALAASALMAQAVDVSILSTGTVVTGEPDDFFPELVDSDESTILKQDSGSLGRFTSARLFIYGLNDPGNTISYLNLASDDTLTVGIRVRSDLTNMGVRTLTGNWSYLGGTGDYKGFDENASGGNWSLQYDLATMRSSTSLQGALVPEPTTIAVYGLGSVALIRRRKRA